MRFSFWTGVNQNAYGGHHINGKEYSTLKKVQVEVVYWRLFVELKKAPSKRVLAKGARVGPTFAQKVIAEIKRSGCIIPVEQLKVERWKKKDKRVGCLCITLDEQAHLLQLRRDEPTRGNNSHIAALFLASGTIVSSSFISSFFRKVGPFARWRAVGYNAGILLSSTTLCFILAGRAIFRRIYSGMHQVLTENRSVWW